MCSESTPAKVVTIRGLQNICLKGQVAWISEKHRLPVKTSGKACFYGEKLHVLWVVYDQLERDYVIYVHIDVNLDGRVDLLLLDLQ